MVSHSTIKESSKQIKAESPLIATSLKLPLSSVPIVAVMERFNYKGRVSRKQIVIFKKVTTCFNFEDMFRCCQHHRQLQNI